MPIDKQVILCQLCSLSIELLGIHHGALLSYKLLVSICLLFDFQFIFDILNVTVLQSFSYNKSNSLHTLTKNTFNNTPRGASKGEKKP